MRMSISEWIHHTADSLVAHNLQAPLFALLILFAFAEAERSFAAMHFFQLIN